MTLRDISSNIEIWKAVSSIWRVQSAHTENDKTHRREPDASVTTLAGLIVLRKNDDVSSKYPLFPPRHLTEPQLRRPEHTANIVASKRRSLNLLLQ